MNDWKTYQIGELITDIGDGGTPSRDNPENFGGDIAWAVIDDIQHEIWQTKETLSRRGFLHSSSKLWTENTVILSTGATIGEVGIAKIPLATKQGICGLACGSLVLPEFLYYKLQSLKPYLNAIAQGSTIKEVRPPTIKQIKIDIPSTKEQSKIVDVLFAIDRAIAQTEALIAKHQRIKTGLMQDLLARGIDEHGQLRDPSTHRFKSTPLGMIPEEWEVKTLLDTLRAKPQNGVYKPAKDIGSGCLIVGQTSITENRTIDFSLARRAKISQNELNYYGLEHGNILISRVYATVSGVGQPAFVTQLSEPAVYESNMMRLRINSEVLNPQILFHWLRSDITRRRVMSTVNASNQTSINQTSLCILPVVIPPHDEQDRLVSVFNNIEDNLERSKSSLKKYKALKQGLMQDLLSGRVSVKVLLEG